MDTNFYLYVVLAVACAVCSAVFSGLTLGLLALNVVQLKLLILQHNKTSEEEKLAHAARRVLSVRGDGNYLLVTLLIGNVAVNSAFSILMSSLTDELTGFLISTLVITFFGEIIPQAVCARHGLRIGGFLYPLIIAIEYMLYPLVKPIAMGLNYVLGEDIGTIYSRKQLQALVNYHGADLNILSKDETQILIGGLNISALRAEDAMTPINNVFGLEIDRIFDFSTAASILKSGYSRVPIIDHSKPQCVVGLLFVKDLVLVDPAAELPMRNIMAVFGRRIYAVDNDTQLLSLLTDFKKGETHLAVVRRIVSDTSFDPYYEHVGIITLEDVIEEILQDEIIDEFDGLEAKSNTLKAVGGDRNKVDHFSLLSGRIRLFDKRRHREPLDTVEALAVATYLATQPIFSPAVLHFNLLHQIVLDLPVETPPSGTVLYQQKKVAEFAVLILMGSVTVLSGHEETPFVLGPWTLLAPEALRIPRDTIALLKSSEKALTTECASISSVEQTKGNSWDPRRRAAHSESKRAKEAAKSVFGTVRYKSTTASLPDPSNRSKKDLGTVTYAPLVSSDACDDEFRKGLFLTEASENVNSAIKQLDTNHTNEVRVELSVLNHTTLMADPNGPAATPLELASKSNATSDTKSHRHSVYEINSSNLFLQNLEAFLREWSVETQFYPDFTATTSGECRLLIISRAAYASALKASVLYDQTTDKTTTTEVEPPIEKTAYATDREAASLVHANDANNAIHETLVELERKHSASAAF